MEQYSRNPRLLHSIQSAQEPSAGVCTMVLSRPPSKPSRYQCTRGDICAGTNDVTRRITYCSLNLEGFKTCGYDEEQTAGGDE